MKVLIQQFLGNLHSWSIVGQNIARSLIKRGHIIDLFSTNGTNHFPEDLKTNLIGYYEENTHNTYGRLPDNEYDCQISYTAFKNFPQYLSHGTKNRFGIWTYEFISDRNPLPDGFAKCYKYTDKILPPSNFAKQVFLNSGLPEDHMVVVPHGIDFDQVKSAQPYALKTTKNNKILLLVCQIHRRKNLAGMLEMYGRAFTNKDDVCLVLKIQDRPPKQAFELSFGEIFQAFKNRFKNHAEIEIIREFIPNIYSLYKSCDIVFYATNAEGFGIPALDTLALGKINVVSNYGGVLDFCNSSNSLLIGGKEFVVPPNYLYWSQKTNTRAFMPDIECGVQQLRYAVEHREQLLEEYAKNIPYIRATYNWDTITNQIMGLING